MFDLKQKLVAVAIGCFLAAGAFAQKGRGGDRPPKPPNTVVVTPKGEKPPSNNNRPDKKPDGGKKGKND